MPASELWSLGEVGNSNRDQQRLKNPIDSPIGTPVGS